jgi:hypothetical protein
MTDTNLPDTEEEWVAWAARILHGLGEQDLYDALLERYDVPKGRIWAGEETADD